MTTQTTTTPVGTVRIGTIDWLELTTPDLDAASAFYGALLGWEYESTGTRVLVEVNGAKAAGIAVPPHTIGDMPVPASWTIGIRVDDVDATLAQAVGLGATVVHPVEEVPDGWRTALVEDPSGAVFAVVQGSTDFGIDVRHEPGSLTWCDLETRDPDAAGTFYRQLFGWAAETDETSGYTIFMAAGARVAGMMPMPEEVPAAAPSHWMPYFAVEDAAVAAGRIGELGGRVVVEPRQVGGFRFATAEDPAGAMFSVLETVDEDRMEGVPSGRSGSVRDRLATLVREGNARHVVMHDRDGRRVLEVPVTVGVAGALLLPFATAAGAVAALAAGWSITVTGGNGSRPA